ncbi:hypothetical protein LIER_27890 [Lithospermum erythrorhizon]|uniref:Integrase catalytic domain-containing protein n=1 Tax=Lithospermum erythrorhizon TaxID=34254 RepID=A0AAV3RHK5_LITER
MESARTKKEAQCLTGRITSSTRFISPDRDRILPFFKAIKKGRVFEWTPKCEKVFQGRGEGLEGGVLCQPGHERGLDEISYNGEIGPSKPKDAREHVQRCHSCQRHASIPHQPPHEMVRMLCPVPFYQWGIDVVGDLPRTPGGKRYAIVAIDYFSKCVEAKPFARQDQEPVYQILREIFTRLRDSPGTGHR